MAERLMLAPGASVAVDSVAERAAAAALEDSAVVNSVVERPALALEDSVVVDSTVVAAFTVVAATEVGTARASFRASKKRPANSKGRLLFSSDIWSSQRL
jgi:hypothetical protein